ncbi:RIP metalloprotease RseP [Limisalsivibrio acetivorans]|uniref:RIP metalloprotease RseP n=1 Tax=Limisalsivibrio acetivorans TaxID=1304888 RepID=UPI0003B2F3A5|nr:RIP metalloprotease RseP [Limisalsivibrio acetivorans]
MISAIILLGLLIFFHELGHFLVAKYFGVYVERFSIGFGPRLLKWQWGETEYALSAIPLGGYVKMYGESPDFEEEEEASPEMKERAFNNKPLHARSLIIFAGPLANFLLAALVYSVIFMVGVPRHIASLGEIVSDMPAAQSGLQEGDRVVAIDGRDIKFWDEMAAYVSERPGDEIDFTVLRDGEELTFSIAPKQVEEKNVFGETINIGVIGVRASGETESITFGPLESLQKGFVKTYEVTGLIIKSVVKIFQRAVPADSVGGPIFILQTANDAADTSITAFLAFMAAISINLGILNLLPIPILDGGHLLFNLIEGIMRKPVSMRIREMANTVGLLLILSLMFFAFYNDIARIIRG